jgi:hypothetical protein
LLYDFIVNFFTFQNLLVQFLGAGVTGGAVWLFWRFCWPQLKNPSRWLLIPLCLLLVSAGLNLMIAFAINPAPRLSATIDKVYILPANGTKIISNGQFIPNEPLGGKDDTALFLIVSVRNRGVPSIADNWQLTVSAPTGESVQAEGKFIPETQTIAMIDPSTNRAIATYKGSDALYNKTVTQPIASGAMVRGVLEYVVHGIPLDKIQATGTAFEVTYSDSFGIPHTARLAWPLQPTGGGGYLAGLTEVAPVSIPSAVCAASPIPTPGN